MPLETPKVPTGTSNGDITLKEEKEVNLEAEYIDKMNRSIRDALLIWGYRTKRVDGLIPFNKHSVIIM